MPSEFSHLVHATKVAPKLLTWFLCSSTDVHVHRKKHEHDTYVLVSVSESCHAPLIGAFLAASLKELAFNEK